MLLFAVFVVYIYERIFCRDLLKNRLWTGIGEYVIARDCNNMTSDDDGYEYFGEYTISFDELNDSHINLNYFLVCELR